jgi:hypothetical protein
LVGWEDLCAGGGKLRLDSLQYLTFFIYKRRRAIIGYLACIIYGIWEIDLRKLMSNVAKDFRLLLMMLVFHAPWTPY